MREKLTPLLEKANEFRITPASAGKTTIDEGEFLDVLGSPPRVREKLKGSEYDEVMSRITPACAGKTGGCFY